MTATLFDLTGEALLLQARIDTAAQGLFSDDPADVAAATDALEQLIAMEAGNRRAVEAKADAWCWVIEHQRARAISQREHSRRLADLADEADRRAQALQEQLVLALQRVDPDATTWSLPEHKLSSRKVTSVELAPDLEAGDLPVEFQRVKTTISPDKTALKAALAGGAQIDGAHLVERRSWRIA